MTYRPRRFNRIAEVVQGIELWKKVTFYVALPGTLLASIYCINGHLEHEKHSHRPEFVPYEHLRIRTKVSSVRSPNNNRFCSARLRTHRSLDFSALWSCTNRRLDLCPFCRPFSMILTFCRWESKWFFFFVG